MTRQKLRATGRPALALSISFLAAVLILVVALTVRTGGSYAPVYAAAVALALCAGFSWAAARTGLDSRATLIGLTLGALVTAGAMALLDWSVGSPANAILTGASFWRYLDLYKKPSAIGALVAPVLIMVCGHLAGRGVFRLTRGQRSA